MNYIHNELYICIILKLISIITELSAVNALKDIFNAHAIYFKTKNINNIRVYAFNVGFIIISWHTSM